ncbi:MAG TPA: FAD-binding oxidoreductase [Solirubrobacteraceae bacterium]|nr:FAD-binding oxidoreductase [Solirubrobacteraceae bacterium]
MDKAHTHTPRTFAQAAAALADASARGEPVRIAGACTKRDWGAPGAQCSVTLRTTGLARIVEHNPGDLTARLEAGVTLEAAQSALRGAGQMLALDPPAAPDGTQPTIGGILATADCGPLSHRYGSPRELVLGITFALSDGTIASSGGRVIKNVAGYDLGRLLCGSFGTLGAILAVNLRLHPLPRAATTTVATTGDPASLAAAAAALAAAGLELDALDVRWHDGAGAVLARASGPECLRRARRAARLLAQRGLGDARTVHDDEPIWEAQRAGQRAAGADAVVRVAARPSALAAVIEAARACSGSLVGRAALGISHVRLQADAVGALRERLPDGCWATLRDAPAQTRASLGAWPEPPRAALELMRRLKQRFDPAGILNPGVFAGGI